MHSDLLVFDIETIPFEDNVYTDDQLELIRKRLDRSGRGFQTPNGVVTEDEAKRVLNEVKKIKALDAFLSRVICIGMYFPLSGQKYAITDPNEKIILQKFWADIKDFQGHFISFNGVKFDVPYILKRSMVHGILPTNKSFLSYTKYDPFPPHFDVMLQIPGRESFIGLKATCDALGVPSPKEGAIRAENVAEAYAQGRIQEIAEYCLRDIQSTYEIYKKVKNYTYNQYN